MAGNALFLAPRETAEETDKTKLRIMVPNPDALLELADGEAEPKYDNIFVVGDASNIPASKAGSVAHFAMDLFPANFLRHIQGLKMT